MDIDIVDWQNNSTAVCLFFFYGHKFYYKLIFLSYHIKLYMYLKLLLIYSLENFQPVLAWLGKVELLKSRFKHTFVWWK